MRKFAFLSIIMGLFVINNALADGSCNWEYGDYSSNANEYLYKTEGKKQRLECDESKCSHEKLVLMPANHYFKGSKVDESALYMCIAESGGDLWVKFGPEDFDRCPGYNKDHTQCLNNNVGYKDSTTGSDMTYATNSGSDVIEFTKGKLCYFCKDEKPNSVNPPASSTTCGDHKDGEKWSVQCNSLQIANGKTCGCRCNSDGTTTCYVTECAKGTLTDELASTGEYKGKYRKCTVEGNSNPGNGGGGSGSGGNGSGRVGKCHPSVCVSDICKACCTKPTSEAVWDRTGQACQCVNGGKFVKENNQWICKIESSTPVVSTYTCDTTLMGKLTGWKIQCANNADVLASISELETYCSGKPTESAFLRLYDDVKNNVATCVTPVLDDDDDTDAQLSAARGKITKSASALKNMSEGFKVSVWKNKEGNFNTARLASDSIAGVVLGTAGGLITSNVVKKNQVKSGFEDIQCTIGGQVVADWGDEFRVGIQ